MKTKASKVRRTVMIASAVGATALVTGVAFIVPELGLAMGVGTGAGVLTWSILHSQRGQSDDQDNQNRPD
jgi:uncharacterized membrane protein